MDKQARLKKMLTPHSAVFIGGSNLIPPINYCRYNGFTGRIYVVNPFKSEIADIPCVPTLADLPETPDLAFISVRKEMVVELIAELAEIGVAGTVVISAGFSEIKADGVERQAAFIEAAGEMPVLGPNCPGFANFVDHAAFMQDHFGDHRDVTEGVAVISNGGAYLSDAGCADRSVPLAYSVGLGNQAILTVADLFEVILDDSRVKAVNLYLESLQDVPKLSTCALKAARQGIPVVVVKGGRSKAGQRATQSHTASLAGDDVVTSALFERFGFIEAYSTAEALETLKMLMFTTGPQGRRLAFTTSSGSYAVQGADMAEMLGLTIPPPTPTIEADLNTQLPDFVRAANPLDISNGQFFETDIQQAIFETFLTDDYDLAVQVMCFPPSGGWDDKSWYTTTAAFAQAAQCRNLPVAFVSTLAEALPKKAREQMIASGMAPLMGLEHGMQALANSTLFVENVARLADLADEAILLPSMSNLSGEETRQFNEAEAKSLLTEVGIPVPPSLVWDGVSDFDLDQLNYSAVVKAISANLLHKTEIGAVALNIQSADDVKPTIEAMQARIVATQPNLVIDGFLIEEMIADGVAELLIGVRRIPNVGLALTLAFGGITVELMPDTVTTLLPSPRLEIERTLRSLKQFPLLDGWRGRPKADIERIVEIIEAICAFAVGQGERFIELEINPLIVRSGDQTPMVVDALLQLTNH